VAGEEHDHAVAPLQAGEQALDLDRRQRADLLRRLGGDLAHPARRVGGHAPVLDGDLQDRAEVHQHLAHGVRRDAAVEEPLLVSDQQRRVDRGQRGVAAAASRTI
jgi:hypothetical protein